MDGETYELTSQGGSWFPQYGKNFTYTGDYIIVPEDENNWRVKFLTSGTFTATDALLIDVFLVGGGGGGYTKTSNSYGGGGGGYTKTEKSLYLEKDKSYEIVIGDGGAASSNGGISSAFNITCSGGLGATNNNGGNGGSGGGAGLPSGNGGDGGSDGSNGSSTTKGNGGTGQGITTREFGESTGDLYAGGGAGGSYIGNAGKGGDGGGGTDSNNPAQENTGGGGYGGLIGNPAGSGASGIVIIRNHRE